MSTTTPALRIFASLSYVLLLLSSLWFVAFLADLGPVKTINRGEGLAGWANPFLVLAFCLHHSLFARRWVKDSLSKWVAPGGERSLYVAIASLLQMALMLGWQPMPQTIWATEHDTARMLIWSVHAMGWLIVLEATFQIDHLGLFGLRQAFCPRTPQDSGFQTPWMYRWVRHPMMFGFLVVLWVTPSLSLGQLMLASLLTVYIVWGTSLEESDLRQTLGSAYQRYQQEVPWLLPKPGSRPRAARPVARR